MGNMVVWKPARPQRCRGVLRHASCSQEAGLPRRRDQHASAARAGDRRGVLAHPDLAGIHFTGSTAVFQQHVEDGGREHRLATGAIRGSSARPAARTSSSRTRPPTSMRCRDGARARARSSTRARSARPRRRAYVPRACGADVRDDWRPRSTRSRVGDVEDFAQLHGRGDRQQLVRRRLRGDRPRHATAGVEVVAGGDVRRHARAGSSGPRVIGTEDPQLRDLRDELFGPGPVVFVYDDAALSARRWPLVDRRRRTR